MLARPAAIAASLMLAAAARGQEPLFASPYFETGEQPKHVSSGDLDGDGLVDAVTTRGPAALSILLNLDGQHFAPPVLVAATNTARRTALADFDGDGDLDIALAVDAPTLELINLYRGVGDGTFLPPLFSTTADGPFDPEAADLDADGDADLAVSCGGSSRVSVLLGDGDATFAPHVDFAAGGPVRGVSIGLVDGDAHLDIALAGNSAGLRTLIGDGAGGFTLLPGATGTGQAWVDVDLGDVNHDGLADALLGGETVFPGIALGLGGGAFGPVTLLNTQGFSTCPTLADVDEDGDDDAVLAGFFPDIAVNVALSAGDGSFGVVQRFGTAGPLNDVAVDDFNHDGDLDLLPVSQNAFTPSRGVLLAGDGQGGFGPQLKASDGVREIDTADIDGDGRFDLATAGFESAIAVLRGRDFGAFDGMVSQSLGLLDPVDILLGDVLEDGLADAVVPVIPVVSGLPHVQVFAGNASEPDLLAGAASFPLPTNAVLGTLADLDADGHLDLAFSLADSTVRTWRGDGTGAFSVSDVQSAVATPRALAAGDLDDDGLTDLAVSNMTAVVNIYLGQGDGTLAPPLTFATLGTNQSSVALGDVDGDDDLDVVVAAESSALISQLANDGRGFLGAPLALTGVSNPYGVALADVTNDGLLDVLGTGGNPVVLLGEGDIAVWQGLGGGAFAAAKLHPMSSIASGLVVRDFDGDGWLDAAAASLNDDLSVRLNQRGPWDDLGHPLAGGLGLPRQRGRGTLAPGEFFEFRLTDARPGGATGHIIGLSALDAPFKGGVMVPVPLLINFPLPLDGQGDLSLQGPWPGPSGATGVQLYFQFWGPDPAGVKSFAASNALKATLP